MLLPEHEIEVSYDYSNLISWLFKTGTELLGRPFVIPEADRGIVFAMLAWFMQDESAAKELNFDLDKGILLSGPIGCGKTTLFRILQKFPHTMRKFSMVSTRLVVAEFLQTGYDTLHKYSYGDQLQQSRQPRVLCFDDLGAETASKYYGNDCNVMAEILLTRYDLFREKGIITHATTNLSASEIEVMYGNRLRSRMREMFNLFGYDEAAKDKRR